MPCQLNLTQSQLSRPRGENPFYPVAPTMVQLRNVICQHRDNRHHGGTGAATPSRRAPHFALNFRFHELYCHEMCNVNCRGWQFPPAVSRFCIIAKYRKHGVSAFVIDAYFLTVREGPEDLAEQKSKETQRASFDT